MKTQHSLTYRYLSWTTGHLIRLEGRSFHLVIQGWTLSIIMPRTIISFKTFLKSDDYFHAHLRCIFTVLDLYPFDVCRLGLKKSIMKIQRYFRQNFTHVPFSYFVQKNSHRMNPYFISDLCVSHAIFLLCWTQNSFYCFCLLRILWKMINCSCRQAFPIPVSAPWLILDMQSYNPCVVLAA